MKRKVGLLCVNKINIISCVDACWCQRPRYVCGLSGSVLLCPGCVGPGQAGASSLLDVNTIHHIWGVDTQDLIGAKVHA